MGATVLASLRNGQRPVEAADPPARQPGYRLDHVVPAKLFDGHQCWAQARAGIVPAGEGRPGLVVITTNTLDLDGSDVFRKMFQLRTADGGKTWTSPQECLPLAPRMEVFEGVSRPVALCDFWPRWHAASKTLLGIGHTAVYTTDWKISTSRPRHTGWSVYDPAANEWSRWRKMEMPDPVRFAQAGAGCVQRYDLEDGSILLPIYFHPPEQNSRVVVARCRFDGKELAPIELGSELSIEDKTRGLHEPSLTRFNGRYFLTLRNDTRGYVTSGDDGLHFEAYRPWTFDDGTELGNYNTQQHWVTHSEGLFLVYTRRGAMNDHVTRHRAPLFMAQVDPDRLCVIRETERILVPNRGARLGNFGITDVSPQETWVTVTEWMQPRGVEKYGSDGSLWVARLHWDRPNQLAPA
jgi:hypothetical protein